MEIEKNEFSNKQHLKFVENKNNSIDLRKNLTYFPRTNKLISIWPQRDRWFTIKHQEKSWWSIKKVPQSERMIENENMHRKFNTRSDPR